MSPLRALSAPRRRRWHGWGYLKQFRIWSRGTACASPSASSSRASLASMTPLAVIRDAEVLTAGLAAHGPIG